MTIETKATIELKDITHVEFHCKKCGSSISRKIGTLFTLPSACGNCDSPQWHLFDSPETQHMMTFFRSLARYSADSFPYDLRLRIAGLESEAGMSTQHE